jgi:MFS family permease
MQRRVLTVVIAGQVMGGAGLAAGVTVGALLARQMLGSDSVSGLPAALFTLGSALTAFLIGRVTQRHGRRLGIGLGFTAGGLGAVGVVIAAVTSSVVLLLVALFVYGAGTATNLQARYAGSDLALPAGRGFAISVALVATTLGAVAGPNLVGPLGRLATALGVPALAGPFLLAAAAYLGAAAVLFALLRPDPFLVARHLEQTTATTDSTDTSAPPRAGVTVGATVMVLTQIAMVAIMTMTPVHMQAHGHGLGEVGLVISIHVAAMFLPSPVTGALVDRIGRVPVAAASGVTLLLAGITAAFAPADSLVMLIVALTLLGLGWNLGLISGTALLIDATTPQNRAQVQGTVDVLIALSGAGGGALSGLVVAEAGFPALSLGGGLIALLLIPVLIRTRKVQVSPAADGRPVTDGSATSGRSCVRRGG